jgi:glycosyltransferase involved in cell wall biosynthesis
MTNGTGILAQNQLTHISSQMIPPRILIAIPCYNEELTIGSIILKAKNYSDNILVVNDGSTDATFEIAEKAGAEVISHPKNNGKAASVLAAIEYAKEYNYDFLVLLDGDGQHNVDEIPIILNPLLTSNTDLVIGSRFVNDKNGNKKNGKTTVPTYRRVGQKTLDFLSNASSAYSCTDSQSGFRALSRRALTKLDITSEGYNIESDMIRSLAEEGLSIKEVPISVRYDMPNGHKKNSFYHGFDIFSHLVGLISYKRPLLAFGFPGLTLTLAGIFIGSYTVSTYFASGIFHYIIAVIGIVALILGLLLITAGFIMNSIAHLMRTQKG